MRSVVVYVLGTESSGKTDLVRQLEFLSDGKVRTVPMKTTPTMGQEVTPLTVSASTGKRITLELRELGGSVVNAWESFITSRKAQDVSGGGAGTTTFLLLFVVDAAAPHQLPLASTLFRYYTNGDGAVCGGWPALVVLQKCACGATMTVPEVVDFFGDGASRAALRVVEADSWNGVGIGDVLQWLEQTVFSP